MILRVIGWPIIVILFAMLAGDPPIREVCHAPQNEAK